MAETFYWTQISRVPFTNPLGQFSSFLPKLPYSSFLVADSTPGEFLSQPGKNRAVTVYITGFDAEACWLLNGPLFSLLNPLYSLMEVGVTGPPHFQCHELALMFPACHQTYHA